MNFIEVLPKNFLGEIVINPAMIVDGEHIEGSADINWIKKHHPNLYDATTPLTNELFDELKSIGEMWSINAEKWRSEGLI